MNLLDYQEVQKHINILNVAYHLCLEIIETKGNEYKAICPFCGYNKNSKIPTLSLNSYSNKYCCFRCGAGGYSIGLYAKIRNIDNKKAYIELLNKECFSQNKTNIEISPINLLADIELRDKIYRDFLSMLSLDNKHKKYLKDIGLSNSSIQDSLYKSIPKNYIKRRLISYQLSKKYNLCGIPGFYQDEDFKWNFNRYEGFFIPVYDNNEYIQGLSIHLNNAFKNNFDIWFSSSNKVNGTVARSWTMKSNIDTSTTDLYLTDNLIIGDIIKNVLNKPVIAFQNISNSYVILKEIEKTNINNITFIIRIPQTNQNLDYIISRIFRDLIPLGYNLNIKYIRNIKDFFNENVVLNNAT